jgi:hypothetical protein
VVAVVRASGAARATNKGSSIGSRQRAPCHSAAEAKPGHQL